MVSFEAKRPLVESNWMKSCWNVSMVLFLIDELTVCVRSVSVSVGSCRCRPEARAMHGMLLMLLCSLSLTKIFWNFCFLVPFSDDQFLELVDRILKTLLNNHYREG